MPDDLSAALEPIRERLRATQPAHKFKDIDASQADVPVLLAALDKILKRAHDWDAEARRLDVLAETETDPQSRIAVSLRAQSFETCAKALRETIRAELTGEKGGSDDGGS